MCVFHPGLDEIQTTSVDLGWGLLNSKKCRQVRGCRFFSGKVEVVSLIGGGPRVLVTDLDESELMSEVVGRTLGCKPDLPRVRSSSVHRESRRRL